MKVLLINPPFSKYGPYSVRIPLGVTYLASAIRDKHKVKILDLQLETVKKYKPVTNIKKVLKNFRPDVVCICHIISANYPYLKILSKQIKKFDKSIIVMTGGYFPTVNPKTTLNDNKEFVDIIVRGEGEEILPSLLRYIKKNKKIKRIINSKPIKNLDKLPFPSRDLLDIEEYRKYAYAEEFTLGSVIGSRGCPFNCNWCVNKNFLVYRERPVDSIIREIKLMKSKWNINKIKMEDDSFTVNRKRVVEFCKKIKPLKIEWFVKTRADLLDDELIKIMYDSGMRKILIGFEDINIKNVKNLKQFSKKVDYDHIVNYIYKFKGLDIIATFLVGHPNIKPKEVIESLKWAGKAFKKGDYVFTSHYLPPKIDDLYINKFKSIEWNFYKWTMHEPVVENSSWSIKDYIKINKLYIKILRKKTFFAPLSNWNIDLFGRFMNITKLVYRKSRNKLISLLN